MSDKINTHSQNDDTNENYDDSYNTYEYNQVIETEKFDTENNLDSNEKRISTKESLDPLNNPKIIRVEKEDNFLEDNSCYDFDKPDFDQILEEQKENENNIEGLIEKYDNGNFICNFFNLTKNNKKKFQKKIYKEENILIQI